MKFDEITKKNIRNIIRQLTDEAYRYENIAEEYNFFMNIAGKLGIQLIKNELGEYPIMWKNSYGDYTELMYKCPICDEEVYENNNYCANCGTKLNWSDDN